MDNFHFIPNEENPFPTYTYTTYYKSIITTIKEMSKIKEIILRTSLHMEQSKPRIGMRKIPQLSFIPSIRNSTNLSVEAIRPIMTLVPLQALVMDNYG